VALVGMNVEKRVTGGRRNFREECPISAFADIRNTLETAPERERCGSQTSQSRSSSKFWSASSLRHPREPALTQNPAPFTLRGAAPNTMIHTVLKGIL
jgi:hypothetical protein